MNLKFFTCFLLSFRTNISTNQRNRSTFDANYSLEKLFFKFTWKVIFQIHLKSYFLNSLNSNNSFVKEEAEKPSEHSQEEKCRRTEDTVDNSNEEESDDEVEIVEG